MKNIEKYLQNPKHKCFSPSIMGPNEVEYWIKNMKISMKLLLFNLKKNFEKLQNFLDSSVFLTPRSFCVCKISAKSKLYVKLIKSMEVKISWHCPFKGIKIYICFILPYDFLCTYSKCNLFSWEQFKTYRIQWKPNS